MSSALNFTTLRLPSRAKFWKKRSIVISDYDPTYKVIYLGNVITSWAKGDGCVDKPLGTLWRNHLSSDKPAIMMKVTVCGSGLKATTKEHGLTEYWAHRITFCTADPAYPKVFCWIYRHEGRKMKQELRCHAVLCPTEEKAIRMASGLKDRIHRALIDFKKEKISRQNARLSLANSAYDNPSMPFRKILLQTGSANYRPPVDRSKSAPKLKVIEEVIQEEEDEEEDEEESQEEEEEAAAVPVQVHSDPLSHRRLFEQKSSSSLRENNDDDDNDDDDSSDDEVTDYLHHTDVIVDILETKEDAERGIEEEEEVDSAASSASPDSNQFSTLRNAQQKDGHEEEEEELEEEEEEEDLRVTSLRLNSDQDTISDESGYSEDSSSVKEKAKDDDDDEENQKMSCDLTVKSGDSKKFQEAEKQIFHGNLVPEFCINI